MRPTTYRIQSHVGGSLWFVPVLCVGAGVLLSFVTLWIDGQAGYTLIPRSFTGGPDAALAILGAVATSMVSLAALVLTITMVVVQLAMGQFSPRIVQPILKDRPSQLAIGIFVGTFAFAMLAMREVLMSGRGQVPGLTVVVAFLLVVVSIAVLVIYVHHIGRSLRVSALIELVGTGTRRVLDEAYPGDDPEHTADLGIIPAPHSGVLCHVDHDALVAAARSADCRLVVLAAVGEFVAAGSPLVRVEGDPRRLDRDVTEALVLGLERTLEQDVAYGFRMLVDIAERSLAESPFLDPTTAVQAIDRLHDCLRHLAARPFPDGRHRDADGVVRLTTPAMSWDDYVHLSFDEIRRAGAESPQVARRLHAAIDDLLSAAPPDRRLVLEEQRRLLDAAVTERVPEAERDMYLVGDRLGIGLTGERPGGVPQERSGGEGGGNGTTRRGLGSV
ncbi:MAG TPA: DUF2254 domain-containing protein [Gaiellales bacterium]